MYECDVIMAQKICLLVHIPPKFHASRLQSSQHSLETSPPTPPTHLCPAGRPLGKYGRSVVMQLNPREDSDFEVRRDL